MKVYFDYRDTKNSLDFFKSDSGKIYARDMDSLKWFECTSNGVPVAEVFLQIGGK